MLMMCVCVSSHVCVVSVPDLVGAVRDLFMDNCSFNRGRLRYFLPIVLLFSQQEYARS